MRALVLSGGGGRGAYELGVYKAFAEAGHRFDLISGSSVGAITAAGIASGLSVDELEALWGRMHTFRVMQPRGDVWRVGAWTHLMYSKPLHEFLETELDYDAIRKSPIKLRVSAVNVGTGDVRVFTNEEITPKRLLASASIPLVFPMVEDDDGTHYWDGGTVVNTPLQPAIDAGATNIACVLLSPVGATELPPPRNLWEALARLADLKHLGNLKQDLRQAQMINQLVDAGKMAPSWRHIEFDIISPRTSLGLTTVLNFDGKLATRLIGWGHEDGRTFLAGRHEEHAAQHQAREELRAARKREARFLEPLPGSDF